MKSLPLFFVCLLLAGYSAIGQTTSTMMQQVAGLQTYLSSIKTVYSTTQKGLNTVSSLKNGSFSLNQTYFTSLSNVSPSVKNNPKIKAITDMAGQLPPIFNSSVSWQQSNKQLDATEMAYMQSVYGQVLDDCNKLLEELSVVVTNGKVQMSDEARIQKIDGIYTAMKERYTFARTFTAQAYSLAQSRMADRDNKLMIQKLYNLNQ